MNKNLYRYALLSCLIFALAAYAAFDKKPSVLAEPLVIADADQIAFSILYVADAQGYLKEEGLDVSYKHYPSGKSSLQAVLDGQADIATVYQTPVVIAAVHGAPVRILSTLHRSNTNTALVARRDLGVSKVADLQGQRIGVTFGTYQASLLDRLLEDDGIPPEKVMLVDMPHADTPNALAAGKVAAVMTRWPYVGQAQELAPPNSTLLLDSSMYSEVSVLATTSPTVSQRSSALFKLMRALVKAERFIDKYPEQALKLTMRHWQRDARDEDRQAWAKVQPQLRLDNVLLQSMNMEADWLYRHGKATLPPPFEPLFASDFLQSVRPQAVLLRKDRP